MDRVVARDALEIRNEIRKTEAALDDALLQSSRLMQRVIQGRRNPSLPPDTCQTAIKQIARAQQLVIEGASGVFDAHAELGRIAKRLGVCIGDTFPTVIEPDPVEAAATDIDIARPAHLPA